MEGLPPNHSRDLKQIPLFLRWRRFPRWEASRVLLQIDELGAGLLLNLEIGNKLKKFKEFYRNRLPLFLSLLSILLPSYDRCGHRKRAARALPFYEGGLACVLREARCARQGRGLHALAF